MRTVAVFCVLLGLARAQMQASAPDAADGCGMRGSAVNRVISQFEIPMDMLGAMFGGGGMQMQRPQESRWPQDVSSEIEADFEWLANTEWQASLLRVASSLTGRL
jgi:hypothetical protein